MSPQESSLCMIFQLKKGPILYSMYAFKNAATIREGKTAPPPLTVLEMRRDEYPHGMGFEKLDSTVYFVGGQFMHEKKLFGSRKIYTLNLDTIRNHGLDSMEKHKAVLVEGPVMMNEGKYSPLVIAGHRKVYVLSSLFDVKRLDSSRLGSLPPNHSPNDMTELGMGASCQFEVYDPQLGKWEVLPNPPDCYNVVTPENAICGYAVVGDNILLSGPITTIYVFRTNTNTWVAIPHEWISRPWPAFGDDVCVLDLLRRGFVGRAQVVGDTLFGLNGFFDLRAYDIPSNKVDVPFQFYTVKGLQMQSSFRFVYPGGGVAHDSDIIHLGGGKFLGFSCGFTLEYKQRKFRDKTAKRDLRFFTFQVFKEDSPINSIGWSSELKDSYVIEDFNADQGYFLYYFALDGAVDEGCCARTEFESSRIPSPKRRIPSRKGRHSRVAVCARSFGKIALMQRLSQK